MDPFEIATLVVTILSALATFFLGIVTVGVGAIATVIASRASKLSERVAAESKQRADADESRRARLSRSEYGDELRTYARECADMWTRDDPAMLLSFSSAGYVRLQQQVFKDDALQGGDYLLRKIQRVTMEDLPAHTQAAEKAVGGIYARLILEVDSWVIDPVQWIADHIAEETERLGPPTA